ncbi:Trypanosomal VSG domain/Trypanosome variant surface glycoprotein C-terminal domain containing protein, putative [Trypanosoma equiperdum]|uniref:Trypanosomal VSG domain/Trypanosome variant surface glycoprotein C-terminal domain containing protein, putative n=1 Tax=Trypanosoma equiperdum TaxID=5694 RepID=A0A1G4I4W2_TRYEQ|nr:Trypanosomal VSG domain/Trypanosome variant surface glycoprotein C-terminal domain containing protein, putative [Trypanosoma equiperdum]
MLVVLLGIIFFSQQGQPAPVDNAKAFSTVCAIYKLVASGTNDSAFADQEETPVGPDIDDLLIVTLPTVNFTQKNYSTYAEKDWAQKKDELLKADPQTGETRFRRTGTDEQRSTVHATIAKIKGSRDSAARRITDNKEMINALLATARTKLNEAKTGTANGEVQKDTTFNTRAKMFQSTASNKDQGANIAAVLTCLCSSTGASDLCWSGGTTSTYGQASSSPTTSNAETAFNAIIQQCKQPTAPTYVTPENIETAVASVGSAFANSAATNTANEKYLGGESTANSCNGEDAASACVDYTNVIANHDISKIAWVSRLLEAAKLIREAEARKKQLAPDKTLLHSLIGQAWAAYSGLAQTANQPMATPSKQPSGADCNAHQSSEKCKDPCKWEENAADKSKGTCKLKDGEGQTNQAAATGGDKKEDKCTGKLEPECGKAPECKWKNNSCKDSSFLVNNTSALMDAAFMSWVSF